MIAIAGGGIGGLTLAVALQRQGLDVIVLERQGGIRDAGAGISLWPNALAALDTIDLGYPVRAIGRPLSSGGTRKLDGRPGLTFSSPSFCAALGEGLVCVDRGELVATLAGLLAPGTVRTAAEVTSYEREGDRVRVSVSDGTVVEADGLVGADGIGSAVASRMVGPLPFRYSGYVAWRGIAPAITDPAGEGIWACLAGGHEVGWLPLTGGRHYWFATAWVPEGHVFPAGDRAYLTSRFRHWPEPVLPLIEATPEGRLVRNDIVDRALPDRFSSGPVALVGDAAHPMRPHQGQGGCQAIEDAAALAGCLASGSEVATAFARYDRLRRRRAAAVVRLSRRSGFTRPSGRRTSAADRITAALPTMSIGPFIRAIAPIAGYRAGQRAVAAAARS